MKVKFFQGNNLSRIETEIEMFRLMLQKNGGEILSASLTREDISSVMFPHYVVTVTYKGVSEMRD